MADVNVDAPAEQAPAMAPPAHIDEQILPRIRWVPIEKSNCYIDMERSQSNPIYKIAVDILMQTNFFRAFVASSTIPSNLYSTVLGHYSITPIDSNNAFSSPPTLDALIKLVNNLGYLKVVRHLSDVVTNDMFQPWRALTTIINLCLTGKTSGFERPRAPVLQILWGVINRAHIDYAERMWEEFTQSIHTFIEDKKNLAQHTQGKKKATLIVILGSPLHLPNEEPALGYLKFSSKGTKWEVFGMPIPNDLITDDIRGKQYYNDYLEKVAKHQIYLAGEDLALDAAKSPSLAKRSKAGRVSKKRKLQLRDEFIDEGVPATEPRIDDEEAIMQKVLEEKVQGKGKEKVGEEQAAQVLLNLQTPKKKNPAEQFIFQRCTPATAEPFGLVESLSLYAELGLTDSGTESDEEVSPKMSAQGQEEGQGGTNPSDAGVS
ncbi:hypothetical protein Tco_1063140 [Tanacetum coccineum]